jgi:hypothetical protein
MTSTAKLVHSPDTDNGWGPLAYPIRSKPTELDLPWRDNAYLGFFDAEQEIFGLTHFSAAPVTRDEMKVTFQIVVDGRLHEIYEDLQAGSSIGQTVHFDLDGRLEVDHPDLTASILGLPLRGVADYREGDTMPDFESQKLCYVQRGAVTEGWVSIAGAEKRYFSGRGFRDRSWGYRNDIDQFPEYLAVMTTFGKRNISVMKMLHPVDGTVHTKGFLLTDDGEIPIVNVEIGRTGAGMFHDINIEAADGTTFDVTSERRHTAIPVPISRPRRGLTLNIVEEFHTMTTSDGDRGIGVIEQGVRRNLL